MSRMNREPIQWEDTLTQKEKLYVEKIEAQKDTIATFKAASKANTLKSLVDALTLENVPSEFSSVKEEFRDRLKTMIVAKTNAQMLTFRSWSNADELDLTVDSLPGKLITIKLKSREVVISGVDWISSFVRWTDETLLADKENWLKAQKEKLSPSRTEDIEDADRKRAEVDKQLSDIAKKRSEWAEAGAIPHLETLLKEVDAVIGLLKDEGYALVKENMTSQTHLSLKTPFRWEEDVTKKMNRLQKWAARPLPRPTTDMMNASYCTGMVEHQLHNVLILSDIANEYTLEWYERRLTFEEWSELKNVFKHDNFRVLRADNQHLVVEHKASGNQAVFYSNGHIHVDMPEDLDDLQIGHRVGIIPFLWHPELKDWFKGVVKRTINIQD